MRNIDLKRYWGAMVLGFTVDHLRMTISVDVFWRSGDNNSPNTARIMFAGVRHFSIDAEIDLHSDLVELVSIEAVRSGDHIEVTGELSNYEFHIICLAIDQQ